MQFDWFGFAHHRFAHHKFAHCKQKGSALIPILLIGLLSVVVGLYFYSGKKSQVTVSPAVSQEELKIYTNEQLGFRFEYKDGSFSVKEDSEEEFNKRGNGNFRKNFTGYIGYSPGELLGVVVVLDKSSSYDTNPFTVWVFDNPDELSIDKWYDKYWYFPFVWGDFTDKGKVELAPKEEATVSGQIGKFGIIDYQPGKPKFIYLSRDKKMYLFRLIGETGDKILSTLKFL